MEKNEYILTYDIGSTAVKLILFNKKLQAEYISQKEVRTYQEAGLQYQKAEDWWEIIKALTQKMFGEKPFNKNKIIAIAATGQMEDCLLLDEYGEPLTEVLLYSDGRAEAEYKFLLQKYGESKWEKMSGGNFDQLMSINKYLWLRNKRNKAFLDHKYLILGSKDYLNFKLSGKNICDHTNLSTTGFLDYRTGEVNKELISDLNLNREYLPKLKRGDSIIGELTAEAASELKLTVGLPIVNGAGDVGAAALGAGAWSEGDIYCYLGTTAWLAAASRNLSADKNIFSLSNFDGEKYITAGAVLNAGQAYDWFLKNILAKDTLSAADYESVELKLKARSKEIETPLFIPFLNGERSPIKVKNKNGIFLNLGAETDLIEMLKSVLEGVSFSLKHNLEAMDLENSQNNKINLIGGGSKSLIWPQLLADILNKEVNILDLEISAPSLGTAMIALKALGEIDDFTEIINQFNVKKTIAPREEYIDRYAAKYDLYRDYLDKLF